MRTVSATRVVTALYGAAGRKHLIRNAGYGPAPGRYELPRLVQYLDSIETGRLSSDAARDIFLLPDRAACQPAQLLPNRRRAVPRVPDQGLAPRSAV